MTKDEALRLALEVLEELNETNSYWWQEVDEVTTKKIDPAITTIKAALEAKDEPFDDGYCQACEGELCTAKKGCVALDNPQPQAKDEPVAWMYPDDLKRFETSETFAQAYSIEVVSPTHGETVPLYTTPPQRKPLTDKQILADETLRYYFGLNGGAGPVSKQGRKIVNAIEAFHNIKEIEK